MHQAISRKGFFFALILCLLHTSSAFAQWQSLGSQRISIGVAGFARNSLVFDSKNVPYLCHIDAFDYRLSIRKFNGNSWQFITKGDLSFDFHMCIDSTDTIRLIKRSGFFPFTADGIKYEYVSGNSMIPGSNWGIIDTSGGTNAFYTNPKITISQTGKLYCTYIINKQSRNNTQYVKSFNGVSWVPLGNNQPFKSDSGITTTLSQLDLIPGNQDTLYTASLDGSVFCFNGSSWISLGSPGGNNPCALVLDKYGQLHAATSDTNTIQILKYNGQNWVQAFPKMVIDKISATPPAIVFDNLNLPYIAYVKNNYPNLFIKYYTGTSWVQVGNSLGIGAVIQTYNLYTDKQKQLFVLFNEGSVDSFYTVVATYKPGTGNWTSYRPGNTVAAYPSPFADHITINPPEEGSWQLVIYNALGETIIEKMLSNQVALDSHTWSNGIYFLTLKQGEKVIHQKIVKQ